MTVKTQTPWQPFQDLGEDDPRSAQDTTDLVHGMLAQMLGHHGNRQAVATGNSPAWAPTLDVSERSDAYLVAVELPGVQPDDLEVAFEDGLLTVQGERRFTHDTSEQRLHRVERRYGAFRRSVTLPNHVVADAIEATTTDGVLQIVVPKAEDTKPRRIKVLSPGPVTAPSTVAPPSDG